MVIGWDDSTKPIKWLIYTSINFVNESSKCILVAYLPKENSFEKYSIANIVFSTLQ
jgi:hypothetical protein